VRALLLGSGGRESALAWGLARSRMIDTVVAAPGNPGIAEVAELVKVDPQDPTAIVELAARVAPQLAVVGPEAPLVAGVGDALRAQGVPVFGPDAAAARIEGSKSYAKELMEAAGIPTARWRACSTMEDATSFMDELGPPYVVKADGLAAGKGVVVTSDRAEAVVALEERVVEGRFGDAGKTVVIEEYLDGEEASLIAFADGRNVVACEPAQDYKRVFDDDRGPNTGGMGSYSPVPSCPPSLADRITDEVLKPMMEATAAAGAPFVGALYAGLALTSRGPKVVEFNCRFGDPETQALIPRLASDLGEVCVASARGELVGARVEWSPDACVCIVLSSDGYPGSYEPGRSIDGIDEAAAMDGVEIFHAGTERRGGELVTAGGRVLAVSARGADFKQARERGYRAAEAIRFEGMHFRRDIGRRAEERETASVGRTA
jgi:phosphoribosylamine--glycine ligase